MKRGSEGDEGGANRFELSVQSDDGGYAAYLTVPPAREERKSARVVRLHDLIGNYDGPDVYFDFDESNALLGIEVIK